MGKDASVRESIAKELGQTSRHCYAKELQSVSIKNKQAFLDLVSKTGQNQDKPMWWATMAAYKSPLISDLFLNYSFLLLVQTWIEQGIKKRLIIVEDAWLAEACSSSFNDESVFVAKALGSHIKNYAKHRILFVASMIYASLRLASLWLFNKIYAAKYRMQLAEVLKNKIDILFYTWIGDRSFKGEQPEFTGPYLKALRSYCKEKKLNTVTFTLPNLSVRLLKKTHKSEEIIPIMLFAKFSDIFKAAKRSLTLKWRKLQGDVNGLNFNPLLEAEIFKERGGIVSTYLNYLINLNIFEKHNISPKVIAYPFENQTWDKMLITAARQTGIDSKIVACHTITVPFFYLNFFLGEDENKSHPQPDIIMANGHYAKSILDKAGFSCDIKNGGSLRYASNAKSAESQEHVENSDRDEKVLVLLSVSLDYSLDLLFYLLRNETSNKTFFLKPHPDTPESVIREHLPELPSNFTFVSGSMEQWMEQVGWAVHIGTTAALECMANGINVLKYLPERIDLDPLLCTDFKQKTICDKDALNFSTDENPDEFDSSLIAEPFNRQAWDDILS
ncbi:MAG TPA: hypothetical protein ENH94_05955 [Phycisphaerales bacterium]|nr:hypothetical protein [Phycisphaerales bacterium]